MITKPTAEQERKIKLITEILDEGLHYYKQTLSNEFVTEAIGQDNSKSLATTDTSEILLIELSNNLDDFRVLGMQVRYVAGLDNCNVRAYDTGSKTNLVLNAQLCQIGNRQDAPVPTGDGLKMMYNFRHGSSLQIFITTNGQVVNAHDVSVFLYGNRSNEK